MENKRDILICLGDFVIIVFIGLAIILLFKPLLKILLLSFFQHLYLILFNIPANIIIYFPENYNGDGSGNGGPTPDGNNFPISDPCDYNYPGSEKQINYSFKVNNYLISLHFEPEKKKVQYYM